VARVEALSVEWVVKGYTRGTRHGAVYLGDAGLAQAHGSGEQGGKKLYYTPCLCAPGWTALGRVAGRGRRVRRLGGGRVMRASTRRRELQVREHAEAHSKAG
jgi:hypothetical protein